MLQMRSHFGTVMANDGGRKIDFFCFILVNMASRRPSTEWGLSPIEERWFIIRWVTVLGDEMPQFKLYNVYKDDSQTGLDVVDDWNVTDPRQYKILEKHC